MATFRITTQMGETHTFTSRSYQSARREAPVKPGDKIVSMTTIKVEKTEIVGTSMVKEMCEKNEMVQGRLNEVEASYIRYWNHRRDFWMAKTEEELKEMFPLDGSGFYPRYYYKSEYYQLKSWGWFSTNESVVKRWNEKLAKEGKMARETSLGNLVRAIVKIANGPVESFEISHVTRGKAGLEALVVVNGVVKNLYAIYAEGPIQRLHIRYLIK